MALIYAAAVAGAALFCASLVLLQKKSAPPQAGAPCGASIHSAAEN